MTRFLKYRITDLRFSTQLAGLALPGLFLLASIGCESSGPIKDQRQPSSVIELTTVANRQLNQTRVIARVTTDGATNRSAQVLLDGDLQPFTRFIVNSDSAYTTLYNSFRRFLPVMINSSIDDNEGNSENISFLAVDSFSLTEIAPASRIANGNQPVIISWTGAASAATYVIAAIRRGFAYTGVGYSQFSTSGTTSETLNQIAFRQVDGINPDTGWYDLYVYALAGVPDSASTSKVLPIPLPFQLANNFAIAQLTGHYGSIAVSRRDSVLIAIQP